MSDGEKYKDVSDLLKNLPKIKAGDDFMQKLEMKISDFEANKSSSQVKNKDEREGIFSRFFGQIKNPWLVPAMGLAVVAMFVFYVTNFNKTNTVLENNRGKNIEEKVLDKNSPLQIDTEKQLKNEYKIDTRKQNTEEKIYPHTEMRKEINEPVQIPDYNSNSPKSNIKKTETSQSPPAEFQIEEKAPESSDTEFNDGKAGTDEIKAGEFLKEESNARGKLSTEPQQLRSSDTSESKDKKDKKDDESGNKNDSLMRNKMKILNKNKLDSLSKKVKK